MALKDDLETEVYGIFSSAWSTRNGYVVPDTTDLKLSNDAIKLTGTVLYADLDGSTDLVDSYTREFAAEVYKSYLHCAAKIIRSESGVITAYDGDRVMAVYIGSLKDNQAVRSALKINYAVENIINPQMKRYYTHKDYTVRQVIGIDTCELFIARTGIRGSNDLVWVGRAANYAAKLGALSALYPTRITEDVYKGLSDYILSPGGKNVWIQDTWKGIKTYKSDYEWSF